jgi:hypothetical protein
VPTSTTNYGWTKPDVGGSNNQWGTYVNSDLDGIDSTVKSVSTAIPAASTTTPVMDGTAAVGVGTTWARADHVHASDTSRAPATGSANYVAKAGDTMTGNLTVAPASGNASLQVIAAANAGLVLTRPAGAGANYVNGDTGGNTRWQIVLGDGTAEGGSNAGSNFAITRFADNGAGIDQPLTINRASGQATFSVAIVNGPSDRTLKENIAPIEDALANVGKLQGVQFNFIGQHERKLGLIAQDVAPVFPQVIQQYATQIDGKPAEKMAIDYPQLTAVLVEAIKTLTGRVEALEAAAPAAR